MTTRLRGSCISRRRLFFSFFNLFFSFAIVLCSFAIRIRKASSNFKTFMCGILFCCEDVQSIQENSSHEFQELFERLKDANTSRGPDAQDSVSTSVNGVRLTFFASELHLRGSAFVSQPHRDDAANVLCWNGEIFEGLNVLPEENDGARLFSLLQTAQTSEDARDILGSIEGPYAVVYYHHALQRLFLARDPLGRRSLLVHMPDPRNPRFLVTSVSVGAHPLYSLEELSTQSIFCIDIKRLGNDRMTRFSECLHRMPRQSAEKPLPFAEPRKVNRSIPGEVPLVEDLDHIPEHLSVAVDDLIAHLDRSVMLRVRDIPQHNSNKGKARVAILFSGGIDSTMLAYLAHRHVDPHEPIDLLNVAFENPRKLLVQAEGNIGALPRREKKAKLRDRKDYMSIDVTYTVPDRLTGLQELEELRELCPGRIWNFVEVNVPYEVPGRQWKPSCSQGGPSWI
ncbi:unnamed protein product [Somion occarium]|uniref:Glutamine amidotransferase type-2 domain-containing protein n=1 Tax=Somion occarium TaxID=3059160 RepID=A0ABP1CPF8_9APHY